MLCIYILVFTQCEWETEYWWDSILKILFLLAIIHGLVCILLPFSVTDVVLFIVGAIVGAMTSWQRLLMFFYLILQVKLGQMNDLVFVLCAFFFSTSFSFFLVFLIWFVCFIIVYWYRFFSFLFNFVPFFIIIGIFCNTFQRNLCWVCSLLTVVYLFFLPFSYGVIFFLFFPFSSPTFHFISFHLRTV